MVDVSHISHFLLWDKFLRESIEKGGPTFLQFVTHHMFKQLIKQHFPAPATVKLETVETSLSYEEENALWYVAGYIPRNLIPKIERST